MLIKIKRNTKKLKTDKFDLNGYGTLDRHVVWTLPDVLLLPGSIKVRVTGQYVLTYHMSGLARRCHS